MASPVVVGVGAARLEPAAAPSGTGTCSPRFAVLPVGRTTRTAAAVVSTSRCQQLETLNTLNSNSFSSNSFSSTSRRKAWQGRVPPRHNNEVTANCCACRDYLQMHDQKCTVASTDTEEQLTSSGPAGIRLAHLIPEASSPPCISKDEQQQQQHGIIRLAAAQRQQQQQQFGTIRMAAAKEQQQQQQWERQQSVTGRCHQATLMVPPGMTHQHCVRGILHGS